MHFHRAVFAWLYAPEPVPIRFPSRFNGQSNDAKKNCQDAREGRIVNQTMKQQRLRANDLSWFDIKNYAATENWTLGDWNANLSFRYMIRGLIEPGKSDEQITSFVAQLMIRPAPAHSRRPNKALFAKGFPRVWDMRITELISIAELLDHPKMVDVKSAIETWRNRAATEPEIPDTPTVFDLSVNEIQREREVYADSTQLVYVDLYASDEQLLADFQNWLNAKRDLLKMRVPKKNISDIEMKEWHRYRALALIDLDIFCVLTRTTISNATIGSLLFPDEYDVDLSERMRKVVRPMASRLMRSDLLSAMDDQVSRAERKRDD
jgi:hypothetical protein